MTRMPVLLDAQLSKVRMLSPLSCSIHETIEPLNTTEMTLMIDDSIMLRDWVKVYTPNRLSGIYRVVDVSSDCVNQIQTVSLEHGITILGDTVIPETNTVTTDDSVSDIDGTDHTTVEDFKLTGPMSTVLAQLLNYQACLINGVKPWVVGTVQLNQNVEVIIDFDNILSCITNVVQDYPEYYLAFDQSVFPWQLHILQKGTTVTAEGRISRNVKSAVITYSDANLCTRVVSETLPNRHLDSANISIYGAVCQHLALGSLSDIQYGNGEEVTAERTAELQANQAAIIASAQRHLDNYDEPEVSIEIDGYDLAEITGESFDSFSMGEKFRLALPDYNVTMEERIIEINYADICKGNDVTLVLANKVADLAYAGKNSKSQRQSISGVEREARSASRGGSKAQKINDEGIWSIIRHSETLKEAGIQIDPETGVWLFASDPTNGIGSELTIKQDQINMVVKKKTDGSYAIKAAEIILAVNDDDTSNISLSADRINIDGVVKKLESKNIKVIQIVATGDSTFKNIEVTNNANLKFADLNEYALSSAIRDLKIELAGNTYTLRKKIYTGDGWWDVGTFSRAISSFSVTGSGGWLTVNTTPQNQSAAIQISYSSTKSGKGYNIKVNFKYGSTTGTCYEAWLNASDVYDDGYNQGYDDGYSQGYDDNAGSGYGAGWAAGYQAGYRAGVDSV